MNLSSIKNLFLTLALALSSVSLSYSQGYTFSHFNAPYVPLSGATALTDPCYWNDIADIQNVPVGFNFDFLGLTIDSLQLTEVFAIHENTEFSPSKGIQFFPFGAGTGCGNNTVISYKTEVVNGFKVFTAEWKHLIFYNDTLGNQFMDYQLKLYEVDRAIEVRFGANYMVQEDIFFTNLPGGSVIFALFDNFNNSAVNDSSVSLIGPANNPTLEALNLNIDQYLTGNPDSSMVYRFSFDDLSVKANSSAEFKLYPNPAVDEITIQSAQPIEFIVISTVDGKCQKQLKYSGYQTTVDISELPSGMYFVEVQMASGIKSRKEFLK